MKLVGNFRRDVGHIFYKPELCLHLPSRVAMCHYLARTEIWLPVLVLTGARILLGRGSVSRPGPMLYSR